MDISYSTFCSKAAAVCGEPTSVLPRWDGEEWHVGRCEAELAFTTPSRESLNMAGF